MQHVRSLVQLCAQREALLRLIMQDPEQYTPQMNAWQASLLPVEHQAVVVYDQMVMAYIVTVTVRPVQPQIPILH